MNYNCTINPILVEAGALQCAPPFCRSNEKPAGGQRNSTSSDFDTMKSEAQSDHRKTMHEFSTDELAQRQAQLMSLVAQADRKAFDALYLEMSRPLFVIAVDILNHDTEAEDVIQEVFLSIWNKAATFDPTRGKVFNWAIRITKNKAIDRYRSRKQFLTFQDKVYAHAITCGTHHLESSQEYEQMHREGLLELKTAIRFLSPAQRRAIELSYFQGFTQFEISQILSQPLGTVKTNIRRGLLKLKNCIRASRTQDRDHLGSACAGFTP